MGQRSIHKAYDSLVCLSSDNKFSKDNIQQVGTPLVVPLRHWQSAAVFSAHFWFATLLQVAWRPARCKKLQWRLSSASQSTTASTGRSSLTAAWCACCCSR